VSAVTEATRSSPPAVGRLLRDWRRRRRLSQLDLALEAGISTRHLSFVETGRAKPSAEMVLRLAEQLDVPLRERNELLLAAGYAPAYGSRDLDAPVMDSVREALERLLAGHEPYPALAVDRHLSRQPPATAGRIVSSPPSGTSVCRPSRKRMSSPPR
jgi:transcriptional regulator with XRE-family HTH domain